MTKLIQLNRRSLGANDKNKTLTQLIQLNRWSWGSNHKN